MRYTALPRRPRRWPLAFALALLCGPARAIPVDANIRGDTFRWVSAQPAFGGGVAPAVWATPSAQFWSADAFVPGGPLVGEVPINLVGPAGNHVSLTLSLLGMEYNSPEADGMTPDPGGTASVTRNGGWVQVQGHGLGNQRITLRRQATPFTHARPVISLGDNAAILQAFRTANAAAGTYITQVSLPQTFHFKRNGVRIPRDWRLPLTLSITYVPSVLADLQLSSPTAGVMTARYYRCAGGGRCAAGEAVYQGVASGYFHNGVRLWLSGGNDYRLHGPDATSIPFSVRCGACDQPLLVNNGQLNGAGLTSTGTRIAGGNATRIPFNITIDFSDVALSALRTGTYQGAFSMLFEPAV
ncbi:hypothetical protein [Aeromonas hydrophila]|uniref:hypothetical protein n=1 Tax=Aeromonas hydrophila TaxID=644 RepID=UPI0035BB7500